MNETAEAIDRVRAPLGPAAVAQLLADLDTLLADRDRLHAIYKAADAVVMAEDLERRERALFELAALIGAYEGGNLP